MIDESKLLTELTTKQKAHEQAVAKKLPTVPPALTEQEAVILQILEDGKHSAGRKEALRFLMGERLNMGSTLRANCYLCCGLDERADCGVAMCPWYPYSPYNPARMNLTTRVRGEGEEKGPAPIPKPPVLPATAHKPKPTDTRTEFQKYMESLKKAKGGKP